MSEQEVKRAGVFARVSEGELSLQDAAQVLHLSYRQVKRLNSRYRDYGASGLKHGNAGKASNRATPMRLRKKIVELIRKHYSGEPGRTVRTNFDC